MILDHIKELQGLEVTIKSFWSDETTICACCFYEVSSEELAENGGLTLCCQSDPFYPDDRETAITAIASYIQFLEDMPIQDDEDALYQYFKQTLTSLPGDSKKRRKNYPNGQWPGKVGGKKRPKQTEMQAARADKVKQAKKGNVKPKVIKPITQAVLAGTDWVSTLKFPGISDAQFVGVDKRQAQRQLRSFVRSMGATIKNASEVVHDEVGRTTTVIFKESDDA